ncbi:hypothetical protein HAX54_008346 [Datura stramonium]|uniref:GRAM domain-containing protein n=1 Tax=Datura stramonium TaxID=4076 RepID=A0ABS8TD48_DATST|nr:hypothetical protein [Datura stramonium]
MVMQPSGGGGEENNAAATEHKISSGVNPDEGPKPMQQDDAITIASANENQIGNNDNEGTKSANDLNKSKKSVHWNKQLVQRKTDGRGSNPYLAPANNSASFNIKNKMVSVKDVLGRWGKKVVAATKKAEDIAGNTWQHLKTSHSIADAALGRIAQGTKVLAEGGYDKIFRHTFEVAPEERLQNSFACYLSTSAGPVMGVLYFSTAKLAFCSDNPLSYKIEDKTEWSYYKVVIPLHQIKAINPSSSRTNRLEKYIQVISVDSHEFWFMGFLNYSGAVNFLQEALQAHALQVV